MDPAQENLEGQHLIQHCVIIQRDKKGYGLTVTGDNPVYVQSVKEDGAAYRTGVQVGDRIIKVNGTVVTHYNHIEVVNLIKSGSYVALTLLGKPPAHQAERHGSPTPPATQSKDSTREVTDERTDSLRRVLAQEHQFYKKTKEEYMKKPSDKLQKELAESTTRIKAFERELSALTQPPIIKTQTSSTGPLSAPPGRTAPINWQSPRLSSRSQSTPTDENFSPPPLDVDSAPLYDNYPVSLARGSASDPPPSIAEPEREPQRPALSPGPSSTSPPQPPERKFNVKGDQLPPLSGVGSLPSQGKKRQKKNSLPEGPLHLRQHSSPDAFNRPQLNGGSFKKHSLREGGKKQSLEDMTGMAGMHGYTGLSFASPSSSRKNLPPSSTLPRAWNPRGSDSRAFLSDDSSSKGSSNTSSPPPTPTLIEPPEKRNRSDTSEIYADGDEDAQSVSMEGSKLDVPHHQSQVSIISMDEDDFASDDEKIEDHGPFNDLGVLKTKPAHLAVFLHYLISNSDPSSLFFWLVTDSYKEGTPREMKKWSYEIYSTFLAESAPLKVDMDRETVLQPIEDLLGSEDNLKNLFEQARAIAAEEIEELLADFRNKRALGLGSLFGDHQLEDDNMDKVKELQVVEQTLMPHLESVLAELDTNKSAEASQYDRNSAMASALTTFMKQVGLTIKAGNNANILERYSSFTRKENKPLFKIKASKKVRGHHFTSAHYTSLTFCNHCHGLLWGIGDQGYQCQTCEYNVHKVNCFEAIEECPGPGHKKRKEKKTNLATRTPSFMNMMNPRKVSQQGQSPNAHGVTSTVHINLNNNWNHENHYDENESDNGNSEYRKNKSGSLDMDLMGNRDPRDYSGSENEGMSKKKSTSELFLDNKRFLSKPVTRSESMKTPKEISTGLKRPNFGAERARRSVAGPVDAIRDGDGLPFRNLDVSNLDTVSEDARRGRSRSPSFLPPEEEPDPDMDVDAQPPPWQQVVDKKILKKLKPKAKEIKRQEFIHELIHTERTHVRNLKVLSKVFYRPMTKLDVMSYEQIKELFPNLDELIKIHSSLMKSMMKRQDESEEVISCIGDVMLERFDGDPGLIAKEACAAFCNRQKFALENLKHRQRKEPKLQQLITNCENDPLCRRLRLQDIISSSYQRLTKYPLLLEGIQKNTPNDHSDSKDIERAIQCTKDLLAFVNQSVKDCENQQRLLDLQRKIDKRSLENTNNSTLEEFKNLDFTKKNLVYDGPLTWRISRTKSVDLHVLLLEDLLILLQKQDDKLVLKCLSPTLGGKYQDNKNAHSPIIKLNSVLTRNVATDKRAFFLVSTSSVGPQIYELVTATVTDRKNWFKYITDTAEAYKGRERGRRGGVSIGAHRSIVDVGDMTELASRRVAADLKKAEVAEAAKEKAKIEEEDTKEEEEEEEEGEKENDSLDEESDEGYTEEVGQEEEEEEEETETTPTQEEVPLPAIVEPPLEAEPQVESESDAESEPETETESVFTAEESKEETETEVPSETSSMLPATAESSPPSDSETDVLSAEDSEAPVAPVLSNRASLAEITNEESVDERCPPANRASMSSESSSSSSNDTLKTRGSLLHMPPDEQDDSASTSSGRSSIMLLELLRSKDGELRKILEEKSRIISELRGGHMTVGASTSESHTNGDSLEARDLVLSAILQANRFTVAVSDVLNPNIDDMTHGGVHLGYDGELTPQQQLVSSTSLLNEQLTTLLGIITERDMARERLRCDLQFANSQIQRLKQGRSSSRRPRELPSQFSLNDDHFSGGFHSDSPRPCSPPSTVDLDSDYARLSEASDYLASEDNMEPVGHSSSFTGYRHRSSLMLTNPDLAIGTECYDV